MAADRFVILKSLPPVLLTCFTQNDSALLFPRRLIWFADGAPSENAGPQEGGEGGGTAVSEAAAERAAEERRQVASAGKQQRREEKKAKKRDFRLATLLEAFISGQQRDDHKAILLSRLLQRNVPAQILLAVLSLQHRDILEVLENYLEEERADIPEEALVQQEIEGQPMALVEYGKELSQALSQWTQRIFLHSSFHPMKTILSLAHHHGVDHNILQLTSMIIQEFFRESGQEVDPERVQEFSQLWWRDALKRLHQLASQRGLLPSPIQDPMDRGDDEDENN